MRIQILVILFVGLVVLPACRGARLVAAPPAREAPTALPASPADLQSFLASRAESPTSSTTLDVGSAVEALRDTDTGPGRGPWRQPGLGPCLWRGPDLTSRAEIGGIACDQRVPYETARWIYFEQLR